MLIFSLLDVIKVVYEQWWQIVKFEWKCVNAWSDPNGADGAAVAAAATATATAFCLVAVLLRNREGGDTSIGSL